MKKYIIWLLMISFIIQMQSGTSSAKSQNDFVEMSKTIILQGSNEQNGSGSFAIINVFEFQTNEIVENFYVQATGEWYVEEFNLEGRGFQRIESHNRQRLTISTSDSGVKVFASKKSDVKGKSYFLKQKEKVKEICFKSSNGQVEIFGNVFKAKKGQCYRLGFLLDNTFNVIEKGNPSYNFMIGGR